MKVSGTVIDVNESQQPNGVIPIFLIETASDIQAYLLCSNRPLGFKGDPAKLVGQVVAYELERIKTKMVANPWHFKDGSGRGPAFIMSIMGRAVATKKQTQEKMD